MRWLAIRSVYLFGRKADGTNLFEERVVCFCADSGEEVFAKATRETAEYAAANGFEAHPDQVSYEQDGEQLIDGYEVWSEVVEASESMEVFYANRYGKYEYSPD